MMVYEQITFFIKKRFFSIFFFELRIDFLIRKKGTGTELNRNRTELEPTETEPNRTEPWDSCRGDPSGLGT